MNPVYTATVDGTDVELLDVDFKKAMFETGSFSIVVINDKDGPSQPNFDLLVGSDGKAGQAKTVLISKEGTEKFNGIVETVLVSISEIKISGRGNALKMAWDITDEWEEFDGKDADDAMDTLLAGTDISLDATDRVTTIINSAYNEGTSIYQAVYGLIKNYLGIEGEVDTSDVLHVKTTIGTDRSASVTLEIGTNILALTREITSVELANWVKHRGNAEGTFQLTSGPSQDATSQAAYGVRKILIPTRGTYHQEELDARNTLKLEQLKDPQESLNNVVFLDDSGADLGIGDIVTVTGSKLGVSGTYRIFSLQTTWSKDGEALAATISNTVRSIEEGPDAGAKVDIETINPQGSPLWIPLNVAENALDVDDDFVFKFDVPDVDDWDVKINDFKITLYLEAYRTWQKTGSSTTHDHVTTNTATHAHDTDNWTEKTNNEGYEDDDQLHTMSGTTMTDLPGMAWNPPQDIGLYEVIYNCINLSGVDVTVNARLNVGGVTYGAQTAVLNQADSDDTVDTTFHWFHQMHSGLDETDIAVQVQNTSGSNRAMGFHITINYLGRWQTPNSGSHPHTISDGGAHTHPVVEGIEVGTAYPVDVELWIINTDNPGAGTKVADKVSHADLAGGSSKTVKDIDISAYIIVGTNTLKLKSTGLLSKGMIGMSGGGRIFVRSRG